MFIGDQIGNQAVDGPKMLVDEVKERLCQEIVADFLAINTGNGHRIGHQGVSMSRDNDRSQHSPYECRIGCKGISS